MEGGEALESELRNDKGIPARIHHVPATQRMVFRVPTHTRIQAALMHGYKLH